MQLPLFQVHRRPFSPPSEIDEREGLAYPMPDRLATSAMSPEGEAHGWRRRMEGSVVGEVAVGEAGL